MKRLLRPNYHVNLKSKLASNNKSTKWTLSPACASSSHFDAAAAVVVRCSFVGIWTNCEPATSGAVDVRCALERKLGQHILERH